MTDKEVVFKLAELVEKLLKLIRDNSIEVVITHPYEGGHPDHDACAVAVHAACMLLNTAERPKLMEMTSYHGKDGDVVVGKFLASQGAGIVEEIQLSAKEKRLKRNMFDCYVSQAGLLGGFPIEIERFRAAPTYNFIRPPHDGVLLYEQNNWFIEGDRWRITVARALGGLDLLE